MTIMSSSLSMLVDAEHGPGPLNEKVLNKEDTPLVLDDNDRGKDPVPVLRKHGKENQDLRLSSITSVQL